MKTTILTILILASLTAGAQGFVLSKTKRGELILNIKSNVTVKDGFRMLAMLTPIKMKWYDRYILKDSILYYQPGVRLSRKIYRVEKGDLIPVRF